MSVEQVHCDKPPTWEEVRDLWAEVRRLRAVLKRIADGGVPNGEQATTARRMLTMCELAHEALEGKK